MGKFTAKPQHKAGKPVAATTLATTLRFTGDGQSVNSENFPMVREL